MRTDEWYCPQCEEQRVLLTGAGRGRRRGRGRGRGGAARGRSAATARGRGVSTAAVASVPIDSDSDVQMVGEMGVRRGDGNGYDTIGSDAEDQEGPEGDVGVDLESYSDGRYDNDSGEYDNDDGTGSGSGLGNDDEATDGEEDIGGTGAYGTRRQARSRGRARNRRRTRARGRRSNTTAGSSRHRRRRRGSGSATRALLREQLGTAARARARAAEQGPESAAAVAAAASAVGDLESVPLAQRRTVARARLYADQLRVEMLRQNWSVRWGPKIGVCQTYYFPGFNLQYKVCESEDPQMCTFLTVRPDCQFGGLE